MLDQHRPVFVDPSGRRRRILRIVAAVGATLTIGYLALIMVAAVGGPDSPAARLPMLPDRPAAAVPGPLTPVPAFPTGTAPASNATPDPASANGDTTTPTAATTSDQRGRSAKPSEAPGNGGRPTGPPGRG